MNKLEETIGFLEMLKGLNKTMVQIDLIMPMLAEMQEEAINYIQCCTELPNKESKDSQLSDMVAGYKIMCKPDANFEKYYSKGFTECWEWLKRITK